VQKFFIYSSGKPGLGLPEGQITGWLMSAVALGIGLGSYAAGRLSALPVFQSSAQWGTVLHVGDRTIVPDTAYTVTAELAGVGAVGYGSATTGGWGNADGQGGVSVFDILCVIDGSQNLFTRCSRYAAEQSSGTPDGSIDGDDIVATLEAFSGVAYPDPDPCAAGRTRFGGVRTLH
jgi:hypothetical protein